MGAASEKIPTDHTRCPRCGYDLRGTIDSWKEACPILATCTECGLDFEWAELLSPFRRPPFWLFEYARGGLRVTWTFPVTILAMLMPWFFWRKLRMSHYVQQKRLLVCPLLLALIVFILFAVSNSVLAGRAWIEIDRQPQYSQLDRSLSATVIMAFVLPFSKKPLFGYKHTYSSPASLNGIASYTTIYPSRDWLKRVWRWNYDATFYLGCYTLVLPLIFVLLKNSRRIARVKWIHIVRIFAYSLVYPILVCAVIIIDTFLVYTPETRFLYLPSSQFEILPRIVCAAAFPILAIWWWVAIRRYLRMDEAWKVSLSVITTSFMIATVATYLVYTEFIMSLISRILFPFGA